METRKLSVADVLSCSANADRMRKEIETVTCLLISLIGKHEKHKGIVSSSQSGYWELYQKGATYARYTEHRYTTHNGEIMYEMGDHGPRLHIRNVVKVHGALQDFIDGMMEHYDIPSKYDLRRRLHELQTTDSV